MKIPFTGFLKNTTAKRRDRLVIILNEIHKTGIWDNEPMKFSKIDPVSSWPDSRVNRTWEELRKLKKSLDKRKPNESSRK